MIFQTKQVARDMRRIPFIFALLFMLSVPFAPAWAAGPATGLQKVHLKIGQTAIRAEYARTESERMTGLMFRKQLGWMSGMLFDYGAPARICMWMKNTYIPLSVAFIDQDGVIVNIEDMTPLTTDSHCSAGWVWYALEMNRGWFAAKKIRPGDKIEGLPRPN